MVLNNIEKLLEKYENGETSLKEEQQLKHYFTKETIAPHLAMYKPMFAYFLVNKQEEFTRDFSLALTSKKAKPNINYKWISVAALAIVMLGLYFGNATKSSDLGTYEDPQLAFNEFSKSMEMISSKFNTGAATVGYLNEIDKGASTLGYLNEMENATRIIFKIK